MDTETQALEQPPFIVPAITEPSHRYAWVQAIPFLGVHIAALVAFFIVPISASAVAWALGMYYLRMFAITGGYHRYFSHRSYKTSRVFQFVLALLGTFSVQKGVLWWAAHHREHHRKSDLEGDIHSPTREGFWWSHLGWIISDKYDETRLDFIRDFAEYPELRWLNKNYMLAVVLFATSLYFIAGKTGLFYGFFVSTVILWHTTFLVNSAAHLFGKRRYNTTDTSRNSLWIALLTMGEGWHNNHHHYMSSTRQGFFWWEIDMTFYILKVLEKIGLVWDLREPPERILKNHN